MIKKKKIYYKSMDTKTNSEYTYTPYDKLPTTTLTSVTLLQGEVENWNLYYLFPITYFRLKKSFYKKAPTCNTEGAILSVRYMHSNRGFPKDSCFKNSIILDISMGNKNVSVKLSDKKIQLCGATSEEMSIKASKILVNYILKIQELLDLFHKDLNETKLTVDWVLSITCQDKESGKKRLKSPDNYDAYKPYPFPPYVNETLARWFIPMISDFIYHEEYVKFLGFIQTIPRVIISDTISIASTEIKMKNHNYPLPFLVNRQNCYNLFSKLENWIAIYDSSWDTSVKLLRLSNKNSALLNTNDTNELGIFNKNSVSEVGMLNANDDIDEMDGYEDEDENPLYHTFIVFSTGSVTQSGPRPDEIGIYYEEFNQIIKANKDKLMLHTNREQKKKLKTFSTYPETIKPAFPFDQVAQ